MIWREDDARLAFERELWLGAAGSSVKEETMESKNRNLWIVLAVVLVMACCCFLVAMAGVVAWVGARAVDVPAWDVGGFQGNRIEKTFAVGDAPTLRVNSFAGSISVRAGQDRTVQVVAVKKAGSQSNLNRITVNMSEQGGDVVISAKVSPLTSNASVALEIMAPAGSRLVLDTGAGAIDVRGITGPIDVKSGAGQVDLRDARGPVGVNLGAGQITYEGVPSGDCRFATGAGEIRLWLPADLNMKVDLSTGIGTVGVGFAVDGIVRVREVQGVIGDGSQGTIVAHTGAGSITLEQR